MIRTLNFLLIHLSILHPLPAFGSLCFRSWDRIQRARCNDAPRWMAQPSVCSRSCFLYAAIQSQGTSWLRTRICCVSKHLAQKKENCSSWTSAVLFWSGAKNSGTFLLVQSQQTSPEFHCYPLWNVGYGNSLTFSLVPYGIINDRLSEVGTSLRIGMNHTVSYLFSWRQNLPTESAPWL